MHTKLRFAISGDLKFLQILLIILLHRLLQNFSDENFIFYRKSNRNANNFSKFCHYSKLYPHKIAAEISSLFVLQFLSQKVFVRFQKVLKTHNCSGTVSISRKKHFFYRNIFLSFWLVFSFLVLWLRLLNLLLLFLFGIFLLKFRIFSHSFCNIQSFSAAKLFNIKVRKLAGIFGKL